MSTLSLGKSIQLPGFPSSSGRQGTNLPFTSLNLVAVCSLLTGSYTASLTRMEISLPLYISVFLAKKSKSASERVWAFSFMPFLSMPNLASYSGREIQILLSKRRRIAGSRAQGKLVAPSTSTPRSSCPTPCICTRNSVFTLLEASFSPSDRFPHIESISSMKMIEGFLSLARENRDLIIFSASPTYLLMRSEDETEKKVPSASVAQALAKKVLPVPGGPYRRIPFHGLRLPVKISGNLMGKTTASLREFLALTRPETSSHFTLGFSVTMAWEI